ncbi:catenin delta-2 isoform X20 [Leptidea sinapis]|nr:catenin delta-2 isoform X2 [Leptidea sinapis]XP_050671728.1 catenin delta-2 isoform X3 [Leptidea sinapis]XP_050671729.1 catenin delta-2 isoform X4 [Leptidea sinapis]XP_050671730.1 catenin delta-2 isoform X5 [Leptidea sinapis]XP_050671732.1 catenin delta-2 isoform X6 [Leptidea sinapis]XP_050671733.1 catenin delta-2 isoform X7 [Leptidea sinapis]XP_050671734.1 catenin delta-2 isoform X8 [Leptidea sinapis]XP_050671735.1 catenin delta-2 isoform X9 [Leptidea sinapis]XP_050671736.1 catenin delt
MQAGDYAVGGGLEAEYSQYVSSAAGHYNHMGHLTMAPSQKYPHVMDGVSVGAGVYGTYGHYGATYPAHPAQPAYLVDAPYMTQEYAEGGGSGSPRSASPGTLPPQHNLHLQQRYESSSLEQLGRHYCVTSPRGDYPDTYSYQHYSAHAAPLEPQHHVQPFKDSQNGLSLGSTGGQSMYGDEEELQKQMAGMSLVHGAGVGRDEGAGLQWRDPNLPEVIGFLNSPSDVVKANAAAYLQHLTYMDDPNKQKTRSLGGIPPLVRLVSHDNPEVARNACGALRNLSFGRQNDENKRAIRDAAGLPALVGLLCRTADMQVKELVTSVIWNMSSCEDLKQSIIDDAAQVIFNKAIIPSSGWHPTTPGDTYWSTVFRNASGVLRNVSSAGEYARRRLRSLAGLPEALLHVVRAAIATNAIGTKIVENCVCVLRNLSYRCQEIEDPLYDTRAPPTQSTGQARIQASGSKGESLGCFGGSKKKKEGSSSNSTSPLGKSETETQSLDAGSSALGYSVPKGTEMLWSPEVVPLYMTLLQTCSNPETLEAAAGALQNLAACYWQPSIDIRAAVRKEKGLPILVELLRMEVDRVVCAVATALRNLALDQRNKELIGKYAMRDLVQKLPPPSHHHDQGTSDDTVAAVLATLNEVIKKSAEFSRALLDAGGVDRLLHLTQQRTRHTPRVIKFAGQVLLSMWSHAELREVYRKHGWREADFLTPARAAPAPSGQGVPHSPGNTNSTLSRPMASTGGTRYEDRTIRRHRENDELPAMDVNNYSDGLGMGNPNGRPMNLQGVQAQMPPPSSR